jgi:hypothetical protein
LVPNDPFQYSVASVFQVQFHAETRGLCLRTVSTRSTPYADAEALIDMSDFTALYQRADFSASTTAGCCTDPNSGVCQSEGCTGTCTVYRTKGQHSTQRYCICIE